MQTFKVFVHDGKRGDRPVTATAVTAKSSSVEQNFMFKVLCGKGFISKYSPSHFNTSTDEQTPQVFFLKNM